MNTTQLERAQAIQYCLVYLVGEAEDAGLPDLASILKGTAEVAAKEVLTLTGDPANLHS